MDLRGSACRIWRIVPGNVNQFIFGRGPRSAARNLLGKPSPAPRPVQGENKLARYFDPGMVAVPYCEHVRTIRPRNFPWRGMGSFNMRCAFPAEVVFRLPRGSPEVTKASSSIMTEPYCPTSGLTWIQAWLHRTRLGIIKWCRRSSDTAYSEPRVEPIQLLRERAGRIFFAPDREEVRVHYALQSIDGHGAEGPRPCVVDWAPGRSAQQAVSRAMSGPCTSDNSRPFHHHGWGCPQPGEV
jgi:hypothetical protein